MRRDRALDAGMRRDDADPQQPMKVSVDQWPCLERVLLLAGGQPQLNEGLPGTEQSEEMVEDFIAGVDFLKSHEQCTGRVGVVGFCFGGGMANKLAVRIPDLGAAVAFYGRQPAEEDVPKIQAPVMIHNAELDKRINAGWPAYEAALVAGKKKYVAHMYEGVNHGFHNDTTPRFDKPMADLAWKRTIEFFRETL